VCCNTLQLQQLQPIDRAQGPLGRCLQYPPMSLCYSPFQHTTATTTAFSSLPCPLWSQPLLPPNIVALQSVATYCNCKNCSLQITHKTPMVAASSNPRCRTHGWTVRKYYDGSARGRVDTLVSMPNLTSLGALSRWQATIRKYKTKQIYSTTLTAQKNNKHRQCFLHPQTILNIRSKNIPRYKMRAKKHKWVSNVCMDTYTESMHTCTQIKKHP